MGQTARMEVDELGIGFLVDRMGRDCAQLQYIRELTQNGIEAISKLESSKGDIFWGIDPYLLLTQEVHKLRIVDTGVGMSGDEMVQYINRLSSSGGKQSFSDNYGVGAKIAALTRNHEGLLYASWKSPDDPGAMILFWKDPDTGQYGIRRWPMEDGTFSEFTPPSSDVKPEEIEKAGHGTTVTLLGNTSDQDTFTSPESGDAGVEWVAKYLEERYFSFPDGISVRSQDVNNYEGSKSQSEHGFYRPVYGRKRALETISQASGTVHLLNFDAHWWTLLPQKEQKSHSTRRFNGYVAALYQNELYEPTKNESRSKLQSFGATFSWSRVVIFVEPHVNGRLTTNTARTELLIDSERLPWEEIGQEFRSNLPQEIKDLEEEMAVSSIGGHEKSIAERLKRLFTLDLFRLSRFRPAKVGEFEIVTETLMGGTTRKGTGENRGGRGSGDGRGSTSGDKRGTLHFGVAAKEGTTAIEVPSRQMPVVTWVEKDKISENGLDDRAANYDPNSNRIFANPQFAGFLDMGGFWIKKYSGVLAAKKQIEDTVREAFEQQLIETVLGLQCLKGRHYWLPEQIEKAWSPEALTAAVMSRSQAFAFIQRVLTATLGTGAEADSVLSVENK